MAPTPIQPFLKLVLTGLRAATGVLEAVVGEPAAPAPARDAAAKQSREPDPQRSTAPKPLDDASLARKVETVLFRDADVPKGKIDVNAADGVVWLRGEARTPAMVRELETKARAIPEVREVENLLHLPKTPAPSRTDTPAPQRKTRRSPRKPAARKVARTRVNAERKVAGAEPSPKQVAASGRGRKAAPLGASADKQGSGGRPTKTRSARSTT